jgi:tRNA threonylcarbamoyladenosine biosynthesis protein TsaB
VRILALDTTADRLGACLWDDGAVLEVDRRSPPRHDAAIEAAVQKVLGGPGTPLDAVAVAAGPGRFTGIRVGVAFGVMLGRARGVPVLGLNALQTLAWQAFREAPGAFVACAARPAVRDELYAGLYRPDATSAAADRWGRPEELRPFLQGVHGLVLAGEGAAALKKALGLGAAVAAPRLRPRFLAERAAEIVRAGGPLPAPEPYYLKPGHFERAAR